MDKHPFFAVFDEEARFMRRLASENAIRTFLAIAPYMRQGFGYLVRDGEELTSFTLAKLEDMKTADIGAALRELHSLKILRRDETGYFYPKMAAFYRNRQKRAERYKNETSASLNFHERESQNKSSPSTKPEPEVYKTEDCNNVAVFQTALANAAHTNTGSASLGVAWLAGEQPLVSANVTDDWINAERNRYPNVQDFPAAISKCFEYYAKKKVEITQKIVRGWLRRQDNKPAVSVASPQQTAPQPQPSVPSAQPRKIVIE